MQDTAIRAADDVTLNQHIRALAVDQLYRQASLMQLLTLLNSGFLVYLLWGAIASEVLLSWLALLAFVALGRGVLIYRYFNRPRRDMAPRWGNYFTLAALVGGMIWGSAGVLLFAPDQIAYQVILFFLLTGMGAGSYVANSSHLPTFYAFFVPTMIPAIVRLLSEGDKLQITLGLWGAAFMITFLFFARSASQKQQEAIRLRLHNQILADEMANKHKAAERANMSKTRFLAAASHDLRQPLFALGLYTEMLEHESDPEKIHTIAAFIKQSFVSLKGLLDALLDISKLDAGVVKVHKESFPLQKVFDRIQCDYEPLAREKNLAFRVVATSAVVFSDPTLVERILRNLVSNAINYTREGGVLLGYRRRGPHGEIQVYDTGIGIPNHELENIFQEFHQLANPERDRGKGIGLGLAIVQRLSGLLGEKISVQSQVGRGTTVCFSLQRSNGSAPAAIRDEEPPKTHPNATILIIEDDNEVRRSMQSFLAELGYIVLAADSEDEALRLLLREKAVPGLIISDYRLRNERNGVAAAEAVLAFLGKARPVMIITGDTAPERLREASSHGYRLLHKPLAPQEFRLAVAEMLNRAKSS